MTDDGQNPFASTHVEDTGESEPFHHSALRAIGVGIAVWFTAFVAVNVLGSFIASVVPFDADLLNAGLDGVFTLTPVFMAVGAACLNSGRTANP